MQTEGVTSKLRGKKYGHRDARTEGTVGMREDGEDAGRVQAKGCENGCFLPVRTHSASLPKLSPRGVFHIASTFSHSQSLSFETSNPSSPRRRNLDQSVSL